MACRYTIDTAAPNGGILGQGSFGRVYKVIDSTTKRIYALKTSEEDTCRNPMLSSVELPPVGL
jgi:serine/threonine protein kinase